MIDQLKAALIKAVSTQAYAALVAVPGFGWFFALPVVRNVIQYIIERITGWAVQETAVGLSLLWIQVEMAYEVDNAEQARDRLKAMLDAEDRYTAEQQRQIEGYFDETTIDLIQLALKRLA